MNSPELSTQLTIKEKLLVTKNKSKLNLSWLNRLSKKIILSALKNIQHGSIIINDHQENMQFGSDNRLKVIITINDPKLYQMIFTKGTNGAAKAYIDGMWNVDHLTQLIQILVQNRQQLEQLENYLHRFLIPFKYLSYKLQGNSRKGSKKNIYAHYDLSNDFFSCFLDKNMMYSSAYFIADHTDLDSASIKKIDIICRKLKLTGNDHLLEIGSGWGGFAIYAAKNFGCKVTTTTISQQQYNYAKAWIEQEGLSDKITLLLNDYRDLNGKFDKIVSIEMIEAVGHSYYPTFFKQCAHLLQPNGLMLLQSITIQDQLYKQARNQVDFIKEYIFPGGCLPSISVISNTITKHTDLNIFDIEDIGQHYARTLKLWNDRFIENFEQIKQLGFDESFKRLWQYYLCYCEGGFIERSISAVHILIAKPAWRQ